MIDRSFSTYGQVLRSPDLRLGGVRTDFFEDRPPFKRRINAPGRSVFVYVRKGNCILEIDGSVRGPIEVKQGTALGFEAGRAHSWKALSAESAGLAPGETAELFTSSISRKLGVLQQLEDGLILIPPDAEPYATVIRHAVEIHICEYRRLGASQDDDDGIIRRAAEMVLMQFVQYARSKMAETPDMPPGLAHDENLLRAWSAYFADPLRKWTVKALADEAGLSRTAFAERFRKIFGAPPLQTLTDLRLEQAESMLRHSKAPLIEIAFVVGYNSEAAFVRAFHRHYGIPPGRFRASHGSA